MRNFDFEKEYNKLLTPEMVGCLTTIHEFKGLHANHGMEDEALSELIEVAKIQSTEASNRIEGIDRLLQLIKNGRQGSSIRVDHADVTYVDCVAGETMYQVVR